VSELSCVSGREEEQDYLLLRALEVKPITSIAKTAGSQSQRLDVESVARSE
jgi:hypothetical protein